MQRFDHLKFALRVDREERRLGERPIRFLDERGSEMSRLELNAGTAWFYADPKPEAEMIKVRFAFWKSVVGRGMRSIT